MISNNNDDIKNNKNNNDDDDNDANNNNNSSSSSSRLLLKCLPGPQSASQTIHNIMPCDQLINKHTHNYTHACAMISILYDVSSTFHEQDVQVMILHNVIIAILTTTM